VLQPGQVRRGQQAYFVVLNVGKKLHNFAIFGKTTKKLRPFAKAHFHLTLAHRGAFRYESTLDRGKPGFHGTLKSTDVPAALVLRPSAEYFCLGIASARRFRPQRLEREWVDA